MINLPSKLMVLRVDDAICYNSDSDGLKKEFERILSVMEKEKGNCVYTYSDYKYLLMLTSMMEPFSKSHRLR